MDDRPQPGGGLLAINPSVSFRSKDGWNVWLGPRSCATDCGGATYGMPALPTDANFRSRPVRPPNGAPLYEVAYNHMLTNLQ